MKTFEVQLAGPTTTFQTIEAAYFMDSQGDMQRDGSGRWVDFIGEADGPRSTGPVLARFNAELVVAIKRVEAPAPAASTIAGAGG
ncbi:MAG: hypothetical protein JWP11_1332 [Frankiales bacterium]|nr:hypothetical protein [Frankiales bacterium]